MKAKHILIAMLLVLALCISVGCSPAAEPEATAEPEKTAEAAQTKPENTAVPDEIESAEQGNADYSGIKFTSSDLDGRAVSETYIQEHKVTVVNFWATWCPPCVGEIPDFSEVAAEYASKGCAFLGVQLDDDIDSAKALWEKHGVTYPTILPDGDLVALADSMQYVPDTILFDSNGKQIGEMQIGGLDKGTLTSLIDSALAAQ